MRIDSPRMTNTDATGSYSGSFTGDGAGLTGLVSASFAVTASYTNLSGVDGLVDLSSSLEQRVLAQEGFSSSLDTTSLILSGSFSGSFTGDGSQLSGVTSYTDADTLAYINSLEVLSGSAQQIAEEISGSFTSLSGSIASDIADIVDGTTTVTSASYALTASYAGNFQATDIVAGNISASYIDLDVLADGDIPPHKAGRIFFSEEDGALSVYNEEADITLQLGQEFYIRAFNPTGNTILNGTPVRASGSQGDRIAIHPALAEDHTTGAHFDSHIIGLATHNIGPSSEGYVTAQGIVRGIDTRAFSAGDTLYLQTGSAGLRNSPPPFPYDIVQVGYASRIGSNGFVFVEPKEPVHFSNISGLSGSYVVEPGELWVYQSNNAWTHTRTLSGSYIISNGGLTANSFTGSLLSTNGVLSGSAQIADEISGSLGANATLIRSLTATGITGSFTSLSGSIASDINTKLNFADTGSFAKTSVDNVFSGIQTFTNINVNGTGSFAYIQSITGSAKIIGDAFIVVNSEGTGSRFAGLQVIDSGSATTSSLQWDSLVNKWQYLNSGDVGYSGGGLLSGPRITGSQTVDDISYPTLNTIVRGQGGDHIYDSNITDDDTDVTIGINTQITGSLNVSGGITGSFQGNLDGNAETATAADSATSASYAETGPFLSSYTETDTLASVTGRGASTTADISVNSVNTLTGGGIKLRNSENSANVGGFTRRGLWEGNSNYDPAIWAETGYGVYFYTNGSATIKTSISSDGSLYTAGTLTIAGASGTIDGNTIIHAGNYTSYTDSKYLRSDADDATTGLITLAKAASGTLMARTGFSDAVGYNPSYGMYIGGGPSNASRYIYAGGYYNDGSNTHTLIHSGNYTSYTDSKYLRSDADDTTAGNLTIANTGPVLIMNDTNATTNTDKVSYISFQNQGSETGWFGFGSSNNSNLTVKNNSGAVVLDGSSGAFVDSNRILTVADEGSGNGLDADTVDGYQAAQTYTSTGNAAGSYLGGHYSSGGTEKPNSATFGSGKLKIAMLSNGNLGFGGSWNDVLWMSTYNGTDVKRSTAIVSSKYDNTSLWVVKQNFDATGWGTGYLIWNSGNDGAGSGLDADLLDGVSWGNVNTSIVPSANNSYNLGSAANRWANVYTNDLHLSNMKKEGGNDIDGTKGDWTIQEGEENLYIINNLTGKKFKIKLEEV